LWAWQSGLSRQKRITESLRLDFEAILHALKVLRFRLGEDALSLGLASTFGITEGLALCRMF
jgi:hypothetical protein